MNRTITAVLVIAAAYAVKIEQAEAAVEAIPDAEAVVVEEPKEFPCPQVRLYDMSVEVRADGHAYVSWEEPDFDFEVEKYSIVKNDGRYFFSDDSPAKVLAQDLDMGDADYGFDFILPIKTGCPQWPCPSFEEMNAHFEYVLTTEDQGMMGQLLGIQCAWDVTSDMFTGGAAGKSVVERCEELGWTEEAATIAQYM